MRTYTSANKGDVHVNHGGNGGVISTTVVTDSKACGNHPGMSGYECRDATPQEVKQASDNGKLTHHYYS